MFSFADTNTISSYMVTGGKEAGKLLLLKTITGGGDKGLHLGWNACQRRRNARGCFWMLHREQLPQTESNITNPPKAACEWAEMSREQFYKENTRYPRTLQVPSLPCNDFQMIEGANSNSNPGNGECFGSKGHETTGPSFSTGGELPPRSRDRVMWRSRTRHETLFPLCSFLFFWPTCFVWLLIK